MGVGKYNFNQPMTWANSFLAVAALNGINYAGHNTWRVPNITELESILNYGTNYVYSDFTNDVGFTWSSTTVPDNTNQVWELLFTVPPILRGGKTNNAWVRPVCSSN